MLRKWGMRAIAISLLFLLLSLVGCACQRAVFSKYGFSFEYSSDIDLIEGGNETYGYAKWANVKDRTFQLEWLTPAEILAEELDKQPEELSQVLGKDPPDLEGALTFLIELKEQTVIELTPVGSIINEEMNGYKVLYQLFHVREYLAEKRATAYYCWLVAVWYCNDIDKGFIFRWVGGEKYKPVQQLRKFMTSFECESKP